MKTWNYIFLTLVIIGAINWLLVGLFDFNLVNYIFGTMSTVTKIIYAVVGISGLFAIAFYGRLSEDRTTSHSNNNRY